MASGDEAAAAANAAAKRAETAADEANTAAQKADQAAKLVVAEKEFRRHEYDSACQEYRYRDQLLVQEFYFGLATIGILLNAMKPDSIGPVTVVLATATALVLLVLATHLSHLIADRDLMWERARDLEKTLHFNVKLLIWNRWYDDDSSTRRRLSGTNWMLCTVRLFAAACLVLAVSTGLRYAFPGVPMKDILKTRLWSAAVQTTIQTTTTIATETSSTATNRMPN